MDVHEVAGRALAAYALCAPRAELVRHNENAAFRVADGAGGRQYLLRLHTPSSANFGLFGCGEREIDSELAWLEALAGAGLAVQRPVRNADGLRVTTVPGGDGRPILTSLLTWLPGEPFVGDGPDASAQAQALGALIARLHDQAAGWQPPAGFMRPRYDAAHFERVVALAEPAVGLGFLTEGDYALLSSAATAAAKVLEEAAEQDGWMLVHADLGPGNVLVSGGGLSPIDFSLCGFGCRAWDLGCCVPGYPRPLRDHILAGYDRARPPSPASMHAVEAAALLAIASCYALHISNPARHEWLRRRMPRSVDHEWRPFLDGRPFLDSL